MRALVVAVALLLVLPASAVRAQDAVPLAQGTWAGTMGAGGVLTGSVDGVTAIWTGWIDGSFTFEVASGSSSGDWDWFGSADILATTPEGDVSMYLGSTAGGPMQGSASRLTLTGEQVTVGHGTFMGTTVDIGSVPNPVDPIDVVFVDASCNVAYGDWTTSLDELAAEGGLTGGSLAGFFVATNLAPEADPAVASAFEAEFDELYDRAVGIIGGVSTLSGSALFDMVALIEEAVALEQRAAQLADTCVFDQVDGGPYATLLTSLFASVLRSAIPTLMADDLFGAVQVLLATGAIGSNASPVIAELVEPLLAERAQELLELAVSVGGDGMTHPDGASCTPVAPCVIIGTGLVHLFVAADMLGVQLTAGGMPVSYADVVAGQ